jgi:hypothetical protein
MTQSIYIDFQAGQHGNFLEFVCNKFLAQVPCSDSPFNQLGAAHDKTYYSEPVFKSAHFFSKQEQPFYYQKIISIRLTEDDVLPHASIAFLRSDDRNYDNDQLEIDTYNKMYNYPPFRPMFENITKSYHLNLSEQNPNCPRNILREFYKFWFLNPSWGFVSIQQEQMVYPSNNNVLNFPFISFYEHDKFVDQLSRIAAWSGYTFDKSEQFENLYEEFIKRQPYKQSKPDCDALLTRIFADEEFDLPKLTLFQESYMNAKLEKHYKVEMPFHPVTWFTNSQEIFKIVK